VQWPEQPIQVQRRYSDFLWLQQALQVSNPGCLVPILPPKNYLINFQSNESDLIQQRKHGMDTFILKLVANSKLSASAQLFSFLTDRDEQFEKTQQEFQL